MARLKIIGQKSYLTNVLRGISMEVRGGHTVFEYKPGTREATRAQTIYSRMEKYHFTALDTTVPSAPVRVSTIDTTLPDVEYTFIPQYAGG
jgi:hypothetical protein